MSTSKIALLTGGSRGLGKDMALKPAQNGIDIILTYRSQQAEAAAVVAAIAALGRCAVAPPLNAADTSTFAAFFAQLTTALAGHRCFVGAGCACFSRWRRGATYR